jgi:hypothetical protein
MRHLKLKRNKKHHVRRGGFLPLLGALAPMFAPLLGKVVGGLFGGGGGRERRGDGMKRMRRRARH